MRACTFALSLQERSKYHPPADGVRMPGGGRITLIGRITGWTGDSVVWRSKGQIG